jgi:hypothetical protein
MRIVFGVLSLLLVLAIVGSLAKTQLQALGGGVGTRASTAASGARVDPPPPGSHDGASVSIPGGMPGATAADTAGLTVPQQSQNIQQQFRDNTARALQQGADRNARAPQ